MPYCPTLVLVWPTFMTPLWHSCKWVSNFRYSTFSSKFICHPLPVVTISAVMGFRMTCCFGSKEMSFRCIHFPQLFMWVQAWMSGPKPYVRHKTRRQERCNTLMSRSDGKCYKLLVTVWNGMRMESDNRKSVLNKQDDICDVICCRQSSFWVKSEGSLADVFNQIKTLWHKHVYSVMWMASHHNEQ